MLSEPRSDHTRSYFHLLCLISKPKKSNNPNSVSFITTTYYWNYLTISGDHNLFTHNSTYCIYRIPSYPILPTLMLGCSPSAGSLSSGSPKHSPGGECSAHSFPREHLGEPEVHPGPMLSPHQKFTCHWRGERALPDVCITCMLWYAPHLPYLSRCHPGALYDPPHKLTSRWGSTKTKEASLDV